MLARTLQILIASLVSSGALALQSPLALAQPTCTQAAEILNQRVGRTIDVPELGTILNELNRSQNRHLPEKFLTKRAAQAAGWRPGSSLWSTPTLNGKSIGGDRFGNREHQLPAGQWREADLYYRGGHRGSKRILFSSDGKRYVTVDHYRTFVEVPACR